MLIGIFGESCVGKSTLADKLKVYLNAEVYTGKDFLRLDKNEAAAKAAFQRKLQDAVTADNSLNIIYVITEKEYMELLPENAIRILVTADIETIKERLQSGWVENCRLLWQGCWKESMVVLIMRSIVCI